MTKEAARRALNGEDPTENWLRKEAKRLGLNSENYASGGALYFYSPEFTNSSELAARSNIKCKVQKVATSSIKYGANTTLTIVLK